MKYILFVALFFIGCSHSKENPFNDRSPYKIAQKIAKNYTNFSIDTNNKVLILNKYFIILNSKKCSVGDCDNYNAPIFLSLNKCNGKWDLDFISEKIIPNPNDFQDNPFQKISKINDSVIVLKYNYGTVIENFHEFYFKISDTENSLIKTVINKYDWSTNFNSSDTMIFNQNEKITLQEFDYLKYINTLK